jgi:sugar lactone lactonase YvrE
MRILEFKFCSILDPIRRESIIAVFAWIVTTLAGGAAAQSNSPRQTAAPGEDCHLLQNAEFCESIDLCEIHTQKTAEKSLINGDQLIGCLRPNVQFHRPEGLAIDKFGNLFVTETTDSTIRKISPSGIVSTFSGVAKENGSTDGPVSVARFYFPNAIAIDSHGNMFVADNMNNTIRKISADGTVSTIAGKAGTKGIDPDRDGKSSDARFDFPKGLAVDDAGNLYFITPFKVCKITADGTVVTLAGGVPLGDPDTKSDGQGLNVRFNSLGGIAVDANQNIYVTDSGNGTIRKIASDGTVTTIAGLALHFGSADGVGSTARFKSLRGIVIDKMGTLFVADIADHAIRKISQNGVVSTFSVHFQTRREIGVVADQSKIIFPYGLAINADGDIFFTDLSSHMVQRVTRDGLVTPAIGLRQTDVKR